MTTKIPARVDGLGMLAGFSLTGGQVSDTSEALPLLGELKPASLAADKDYDTNAILHKVSGSTHATDKKLAKLRCLVHHAIRRHEGFQGLAGQALSGRSFAAFFPQQANELRE